MKLLTQRAFARAGLLGNPSDGYNGKTLSFAIRNYHATVYLYEWEDVEIVLAQEDRCRFRSVRELVQDVELHGYYGGIRLIKATIKKFVEYCEGRHELHDRNFSIRYETNIPRQVGLAGSSAIIVATLHALMEYYEVEIPLDVQPSFILRVETEELGIAAGLQDRVIQVYGGLVYMDFSQNQMVCKEGLWCGCYEPIDPSLLPPVYVAYSADVGEPTEVFHNDLRARYGRGETEVVNAMAACAALAKDGRDAIVDGRVSGLSRMIDENFAIRQSICSLPETHVEMVNVARSVGASAKFAGSGGAIVGVYEGDRMFADLQRELTKIGCRVIKPDIG